MVYQVFFVCACGLLCICRVYYCRLFVRVVLSITFFFVACAVFVVLCFLFAVLSYIVLFGVAC